MVLVGREGEGKRSSLSSGGEVAAGQVRACLGQQDKGRLLPAACLCQVEVSGHVYPQQASEYVISTGGLLSIHFIFLFVYVYTGTFFVCQTRPDFRVDFQPAFVAFISHKLSL